MLLKNLTIQEVMCLNTLLRKTLDENPEAEKLTAKEVYFAGCQTHAELATHGRVFKDRKSPNPGTDEW